MGLKDLKIIMKMKGISPEELSQKSGVPKSTIDKILSGNTPDPRYNTVKELVNALNLNVDELIYYLDLSADDISNSLTPQDISMAYKYHALDIHGKEIVSLLLQKDYERCSASSPQLDPNAFEEFLSDDPPFLTEAKLEEDKEKIAKIIEEHKKNARAKSKA